MRKKGLILFIAFLLFLTLFIILSSGVFGGHISGGYSCDGAEGSQTTGTADTPDCTSGSCVDTVNGKRCKDNNYWIGSCGSGYSCSFHKTTCTKSGSSDKVCATNYYCNGGSCVVVDTAKKNNGLSCTSDLECKSNVCSLTYQGKKCIGKGYWVGNCGNNYQCFERICIKDSISLLERNCAGGYYCSGGSCIEGKSDGSSCISGFECKSNNCWDTFQGKKCISDNYWVGNCGFGYSCFTDKIRCIKSGSSDKVCATNYYCDNNSCLEKKNDGGTCSLSSECKSTNCQSNKCISDNYWIGSCGSGYSCNNLLGCVKSGSPSKLCADGHYCDNNSCLEKKNDGGTCSLSSECKSTNCVDTVNGKKCKGSNYWVGDCGALTGGWGCSNDNCISNTQGVQNICANGYYCGQSGSNIACLEKKNNGISCTLSSECKSGFCTGGVCSFKKADGELCSTNGECISGSCVKAVGKGVYRCKGNNYWIGECGTSASGWQCSNDKTKCLGTGFKICGGDYYCNTNSYSGNIECSEKKIDSASCILSIECRSGFCTGGLCGQKKLDGISCTNNDECYSTYCDNILTPNVCRPQVQYNQVASCGADYSCNEGHTYCLPSSASSPIRVCTSGYYCEVISLARCLEKKEINANCAQSYECLSGNCAGNVCGVSLKLNGEFCSSNTECQSGNCELSSCRPVAIVGVTGACGSGYTSCYWFDGKTCIPSSASDPLKICEGLCYESGGSYYCSTSGKKNVGAACGSNTQCITGLCSGGICVKRPDGQSCTNNDECVSGNCASNVCATTVSLKTNSEFCSSNTECQSNYCDIILSPRVCRPSPTIDHLCGTNYNCDTEHDKCIPKSFNDPIILCPVGAGIPYYCLEAGGSANCGLQKKSDEMPCSQSYECQSNYCVNNICGASLKLNGEVCSSGGECLSGACVGGICIGSICEETETLFSGSQSDLEEKQSIFLKGGTKTRVGTAPWSTITLETCTDGVLTERYCLNGGSATSESVTCVNGCASGSMDGGCNIPTCIDSDGVGYTTSGTTIGLYTLDSDALGVPPATQSAKTYSDECTFDTMLKEYKCSGINNNLVVFEQKDCATLGIDYICSEGRCGKVLSSTCVNNSECLSGNCASNICAAAVEPPGGGGGGGDGGDGGDGLEAPSCKSLGGKVCLNNEECEGGNPASDTKESTCCVASSDTVFASCKSKPVYILQSAQSVTFVKTCKNGQTHVKVVDSGDAPANSDSLSALGLTSSEYVDQNDYSCADIDLGSSGGPVPAYSLMSLIITMGLLILFYSFRTRFI